ncbi:hypothetical protein MRB53_008652 [Persea americana]|uniref:Uncharacterized protein n=1 Tax=Persea americana TaxID=3435 RepID=A0ACC2MNI1_PERAE|nr:hypothetical protein MRB53_008652 [Persea americana]
MELGLRLGEAPKPFSFMDTSTEMSKGFGPCLGLGVGLYTKGEERASVDTPVQLDLLPLVPVPRYPPPHLMFSLPTENRVSESGVSGNLTTNRGFDVNHLPSTEDIDDRAAASSPNSAVSSYQMDFSIYTRGGSKRNAEDAALNEVETERASSRASDDEENGLARKKLRLSKEQSAFLEESFKENNTLNPKQKLALAKRLSLRPRQVEVWFQNRRARLLRLIYSPGSQRKDSNGKATTAIITAEAEKGEQNTVLATTTGTLDNNGKALLSSTNTGNNTWIIDSACSDHITFDASKIQNLKSSSQKNITTADGSESSIIGEGTLSITENLNLDTVLVVPDLKYNLLSVSQITKSLSCVVIFWPNFCVFKSIQTRKTIGCGIRRGKLYYLDLASKYSEKLGQAFALEENSDKKKTEELMYFEPVSGIQDENRGDHGIQTLSLDEIQLLRMDDTDKEIRGEAENVTYENVVAEHSEHVASEVRETEPEAPEIEEVTDGEAIGSEVTEGLLDDNPGSLNDIPHQSSNKGTNVSSRVLPARQNRGIPKSSYEPNLTNYYIISSKNNNRTKLKQTEVDCEYLKRCCETLTEENRRLHKELQELKALKTTNPFHMQLPATTLTMCPSCERVATTTTTTNNETTQKTATLQATNRPWFFPLSQPAD